MTVLSLALYAAVTGILGAVQIIYNALWIGAAKPPFLVPDWLIAVELGWSLASIDLAVRMRRRALSIALPASYVAYSAATLAYSSWLASASGTGDITNEMIPLWWKLAAVGVGAWYIAGGVALVATARKAAG